MSYLNNDEIEVTSIVQFDVEKKPKIKIFFCVWYHWDGQLVASYF